MSAPTLVVGPEAFGRGRVTVVGESYRHLFRARRLAVGDAVRVVDGAGAAHLARVEAIDRREGHLAIGDAVAANEPSLAVTLCAAMPRPERAAWLVEKATEIGVTAIRFVVCERSPRPAGGAALARLGRIAIAAVEQSHRARVPEVTGDHSLERVDAIAPGDRWCLAPGAAGRLVPGPGPAATVAIGPEGGWTEPETELLRDHGFRTAGLGPRTLRTETAAVVAAARLLAG